MKVNIFGGNHAYGYRPLTPSMHDLNDNAFVIPGLRFHEGTSFAFSNI